jgi:hypothetical protein
MQVIKYTIFIILVFAFLHYSSLPEIKYKEKFEQVGEQIINQNKHINRVEWFDWGDGTFTAQTYMDDKKVIITNNYSINQLEKAVGDMASLWAEYPEYK